MNRRIFLSLLLATALAPAWAAHDHGTPAAPRDPATTWQKSLARPPLAVGVAFDARGRLWQARVDNGRLLVSRSTDAGQRFTPAVAVNREPERIAADGENRPQLAFGDKGEVYVLWTRSLEAPFSGHVRFARSLDDGRSFGAPLTVNDNREVISHRFGSLLVDGRGRVWVAWLDKRDHGAAKRRGEYYPGAALYYARSEDRGASFSANLKLADHSCECCRVALTRDADGGPVAMWRHIFAGRTGTEVAHQAGRAGQPERNIRDHALARLDDKPVWRRITHDGWAVDACPHHGPTLAIGNDGVMHLAWYSGAPDNHGLFYARATGPDAGLGPVLPFGNNNAQAGHPALWARGNSIHLVWKEFDGARSLIRAMQSHDGGETWSAAHTLATTRGRADYPQLAGTGQAVYLAWYTADEGLRLIGIVAP